ncbi:MAG TPA: type IV pilin protein [Steroidobacteraceae bacterium]|nr:type IV pilin protein [Steroidobacteraceae bacterium]
MHQQSPPAEASTGPFAAPRKRGPTLLELAVGLVVLAVAVAIAVPLERMHALRSGRREATAALQHIQAAEESFFLQHNRYTSALTAPVPDGLGLSVRSASGRYALTVELHDRGTLTGFAARAQRLGAGADPLCRSFSLDQNGLRNAQDDHGHDRTSQCWR